MAGRGLLARLLQVGIGIGTIACSSPADVRNEPPGEFAANEPAALTQVLDYSYTGTHSGGSTGDLDGTGIGVTDWDSRPADECRILAAAASTAGSSPYGSQVWESYFDNGHSGSGPCRQDFDLGAAYDTVHVTVAVYWQSGWEANNTSEKFIYLNNNDSGIIEFLYTDLVIAGGPTSATGCPELETNQAGTPLAGRSEPCDAQQSWPIDDGTWTVWEFQMIQVGAGNNGSMRVWQDGQLLLEHTGRTFGQIHEVSIVDTWGGGGSLSQEQGRLIGRWRIARSAN